MPVATTRLPQEISDYLSARSKITGESVSDLLRQAAEDWISRQDAEGLIRAQRQLDLEREAAMQKLLELQKKRERAPQT